MSGSNGSVMPLISRHQPCRRSTVSPGAISIRGETAIAGAAAVSLTAFAARMRAPRSTSVALTMISDRHMRAGEIVHRMRRHDGGMDDLEVAEPDGVSHRMAGDRNRDDC